MSVRACMHSACVLCVCAGVSVGWGGLKLQALVYDILPRRKVPESDARIVGRSLFIFSSC